jgi:hypothetical protein
MDTHHWSSPAKRKGRRATVQEQSKSDLLQDERCKKCQDQQGWLSESIEVTENVLYPKWTSFPL